MKKVILLSLAVGLILVPSVFASELLDRAASDYNFQLEKYRDEYQAFDLKRSQYQNLDTFANLEELVSASRQMLIRRDEVWNTFFQAARIKVLETSGFELLTRDELTKRIEAEQNFIREHQKLLENVQNKDELLTLAQEINDRNKLMENLAYETLSMTDYALLRTAINTLKVFNDDLIKAAEVQIRDAGVRESRLRGLAEMRRHIDLSESQLEEVREKRINFGSQSNPRNAYSKVTDELTEVHVNIRRAQKLGQELSDGVEL